LEDREIEARRTRALERAYDLAQRGACTSVGEIIAVLKREGHVAPLTDLRSRDVQRELRALCGSRGTGG
jgi:hypothetical protein